MRAIAYACEVRRCIYGREPGWPVDAGSSSVDLGDATSAVAGFDSGAMERVCRLLKDLAGEDADTRCSVVAVEARATAQRLVSIHGRAQLMACVWRPSTDCLGPSKREIFERFERSVC